MLFCLTHVAQATSYLSHVRDLISTSAPGAAVDQEITFRLTQPIPAGGAIIIDFEGDGVTVPGFGFNYLDLDVAFSVVPGGPYTERPLAPISTAGTDGVTVAAGVGGSVRIDLNTSVGIPANSEVRVRMGTNAVYGGTGDTPMVLSAATGSYPVIITTYDASDIEIDYGQTRFVVVSPVTAGPIDTTDEDPPIILVAEPTGILQVGTRGVQMYLETNELAACRYATSSMSFASMPYQFMGTSSESIYFWHFADVTGLEDDTTYTYYVRCQDFRFNEIDPDYILEFTVGIPPGSATTTSTSTSPGSGGEVTNPVASSTCTGDNCVGTGTGSGGGPSGSGSGNGPIGGDGAGSGSGGTGSGTGDGDKLPLADVRISGWAYPGSTVSFLRDGAVVDTTLVSSDAVFEQTTRDLDRGSYTFSVYAVDSAGTRSATFSTTLWLQASTLNTLSNIMLPPTVTTVENSVDPGTPIDVTGYSMPDASVTTWLRPRLAEVSTSDIVSTTTAAGDGTWSLTIPTTGLPQGTYELVAQAMMDDGTVESDKSARKTIGVGVEVGDESCVSIGDLNCDGSVNLVDFSILLFNWNTTGAVADINGDGTVSLPDFSIMLYNWTG